jgi:hypothetical protein
MPRDTQKQIPLVARELAVKSKTPSVPPVDLLGFLCSSMATLRRDLDLEEARFDCDWIQGGEGRGDREACG